MKRGRKTKYIRRARPRLRGLSPEQRRQHKIELRRDWEQRNKKKLVKARKAWLRGFRKRPLFKNPLNERAVFLYQKGHTALAIAEMLNITKGRVTASVWRAGIKRKSDHRVSNRLQKESTITQLVVGDYRQEKHLLKSFDETLHWLEHPELKAWQENRRAEKHRKTSLKNHRKYYQVRLAKFLGEFKCKFCESDGSAIPLKRQKLGLKYCSARCQKRAQMAAVKHRLQSDPQLWQRNREARKRCYNRTRRERPEVIRAAVRRKLANPINRIMKIHRDRLHQLVSKKKMIKTKSSIKYFGCPPAFLKQHIESQFKPGMTWANRGKKQKDGWEIDHIIPLDNYDLSNPAECDRAFNWTNLRPLFTLENRKKSNKLTHPQQSLPLVIE